MSNNSMQANNILRDISNMLKIQKDAFIKISKSYPLQVAQYKAYRYEEGFKGTGKGKLWVGKTGEPEIIFYEQQTLWLPVDIVPTTNKTLRILFDNNMAIVTNLVELSTTENRFFHVTPILDKNMGRKSVQHLINKALSEVSESPNLNSLLSEKADCNVGIKLKDAGIITMFSEDVEQNHETVFWFVPENAKQVKETMFFIFNIYEIKKQLEACNALRDYPTKYQSQNLQWFGTNRELNYYLNKERKPENIKDLDWETLDPNQNVPARQQGNFVLKALNTPDIAILEGPPGSGKTKSIVELILQIIKRGERVLMVSATHVAVDNVFEKLYQYQYGIEPTNSQINWAKEILGIRVAASTKNIKIDVVRDKYHVDSVVDRILKEANEHFAGKQKLTEGQKNLKSIAYTDKVNGKQTNEKSKEFKHFLLNRANLVAGTLVGLLQHESLRNEQPDFEPFDYIILDEASKVTLPGFLVPARFAKKWILVGDTKQLAPYSESTLMEDFIMAKFEISFEQAEKLTQLINDAYAYRLSQEKDVRVWNLMKKIRQLGINQAELMEYARYALPSVLELFQEGLPEWLAPQPSENPLIQTEGVKNLAINTDHWESTFQSLSYQWRMVDELAMIPRKHFYNGKNMLSLSNEPAKITKEKNYLNILKKDDDNNPLAFVVTDMHKGNDTKCENEVKAVVKALKQINASIKENDKLPSVIVVTFYSKQGNLLEKELNRLKGTLRINPTLKTVDSVQGQEADIVLLCFTKASDRAFYNVPNRLNVALTRAKYRLILFGNPERLKEISTNKAILDLCENANKINL